MKKPSLFHPAVAAWFDATFHAPTEAQAQAWPAIKAGDNVLIAAPTGSGKTLAAFLAAIDGLVRQALANKLPEETRIVYVSPLKALSNDIERNLEAPLSGIRAALAKQGLPEVEIRTWVRTGDTPSGERDRMRRRPPHIVVTTPESLYILLGSQSGRAMLATTRTIIIDEIHALAPNKRGAHLALSLERLDALCGRRLLRVGLSATQKPIEEVARFLLGRRTNSAAKCRIIDAGHRRARDLAIEVPELPAGSSDVGGRMERGVPEAGAAHRGAPHHAHLRQHAPHGRARRARPVGNPGRGACHRASRQPRQGAAACRRAAAQARRAQGAGGDRFARARHRYRGRGSRLPDRLAPLDRDFSSARGPFRPCRHRYAQRAPLPALARRARGVCGAARQHAPGRARSRGDAGRPARRARATDRRRACRARVGGGRAL